MKVLAPSVATVAAQAPKSPKRGIRVKMRTRLMSRPAAVTAKNVCWRPSATKAVPCNVLTDMNTVDQVSTASPGAASA